MIGYVKDGVKIIQKRMGIVGKQLNEPSCPRRSGILIFSYALRSHRDVTRDLHWGSTGEQGTRALSLIELTI